MRTRWNVAARIALATALAIGVIVLAFVWPAATAKAKDLPVGIAGPASQVRLVEQKANATDPHPIAFVAVSSRADAVQRIRDRRVDGALLLGTHTEVLVAGAAGAAPAQVLRGIATTLQQQESAAVEAGLVKKVAQLGATLGAVKQAAAAQVAAAVKAIEQGRTPTPAPSSSSSSGSYGAGATQGAVDLPTVRVTDVVALSSTDATGAGINAAAFPLVLAGVLGGILMSLLVVGPIRRLLGLAVLGLVAGPVLALVLQTWLRILQRDWLLNGAALSLAVVATASLVIGCNALIGRAGIAVGSVVSTLIGNPISGAAVPWQFLPAPWGAIGQWFVPGAGATLLRSLSYFPSADTAPQWIALGAWAVGGAVLTVAGHFRSQADLRQPEPAPRGPIAAVAAR